MPEYAPKARAAHAATVASTRATGRASLSPTPLSSAGRPSGDRLDVLHDVMNHGPGAQTLASLSERLNAPPSAPAPSRDDTRDQPLALRTGARRRTSDGREPEVAQRKLSPGLERDTAVVHHEDDGDVPGYRIDSVTRFGYNIGGLKNVSNVTSANTEWGTEADKAESRKKWEEARRAKASRAAADTLRQQLIVGENYLSADYRRINPLLAALEKQGYTAAQVRAKDFDYSAKANEVLADMKAIAVDRKYALPEAVSAWTVEFLSKTYQMLRTLLDVWGQFSTPRRAGGENHLTVYRGDGRFLYDSFPTLNPSLSTNRYHEGTNNASFDVIMPGFLSTTYGDPKTHSYVKGKTIVWDLTLPAAHEGKTLGQNNPAEQEMTFPVGTVLRVHSLLVRLKDKTQEAATYGTDADVVVKASVVASG